VDTSRNPARSNPVLITGCSSGIGQALAERLTAAGYVVYATARRPQSLEGLAAAGARTLALDVTDEASMTTAVRLVESEHGAVGVLVNNAGYGLYGPVEEASPEDVRRQFETNVVGLGTMCRLVLPAMRAAGRGRIVNIGSVGGRLAFPGGGWYHASKYAVEALSDVLRVEVAGFGVRVVLVEPGPIRTGFGTVAVQGTAAATASGPYAAQRRSVEAAIRRSYSAPGSVGPDAVARVVQRAIEAPRPRPRYVVTPRAVALIQTRRLGGDHLWDALMRRAFGISSPSGSPGPRP
jgi:NADP-dependent 3-hydroxy acid dehydrogenase YdfG